MTDQPWTDADLELYLDQELDAERAAALATDLMTSPDLRQRLRSLALADEIVREALSDTLAGSGARPRRLVFALPVAAAIVLALLSLPTLTRTPEPAPPTSVVPVLLEIRAPDPALLDMLEQGDDVGVVEHVRQADAQDRAEALRTLGRSLRSAMTAREALDAMPASEQLEACQVWAAELSLRPVAFERLVVLSSDPDLRPEVRRIVAELEQDTQLMAWLRSYGLVEHTRTP